MASDAAYGDLFTNGMQTLERNDCENAIADLNSFLRQNKDYIHEHPHVRNHIDESIKYCNKYQDLVAGASGGGGKGDCPVWPSIFPEDLPLKPQFIPLSELAGRAEVQIKNGESQCLDLHAPDQHQNEAKVQVCDCHGALQQTWQIFRK